SIPPCTLPGPGSEESGATLPERLARYLASFVPIDPFFSIQLVCGCWWKAEISCEGGGRRVDRALLAAAAKEELTLRRITIDEETPFKKKAVVREVIERILEISLVVRLDIIDEILEEIDIRHGITSLEAAQRATDVAASGERHPAM